MDRSPVIIVGGGLAGLSVALCLAPRPCVVLGHKIGAGKTSSELAQGGIAAAVCPDDAAAFHEKDTLAAGAGFCDPLIVRMVTRAASEAVEWLASCGVAFDRDEISGVLKTGLEGAHSHRRIVHARGDSTGAAIMQALFNRVGQTPSIALIEEAQATEILLGTSGAATGVVYRPRGGGEESLSGAAVVLATGSACALWQGTTVPLGSWGHGLLLAHKAGASLQDLEFVQFHPTGLSIGRDPMPLISEAVRGDGAKLVTDKGDSFVDELAPRDVVARAILAEEERGRNIFLDARHLDSFSFRFPTVFTLCRDVGLNPSCDLIPIRPVAHYHMGGIATDAQGRTNVPRLWACGECASTGLHGANRLASNSLLEAVVMGQRVAFSIMRSDVAEGPSATDRRMPTLLDDDARATDQVRKVMTRYVGMRRDASGLQKAIEALAPLEGLSRRAQVAMLIARSALARGDSVGAHYRLDGKTTRIMVI